MPEQWTKLHLSEVGAASLSDREFRVLMVFKLFRNSRTHKAWPSRQRVAEILNCKERSLERPIRQLIRKGWLTPANKPGTGRRAEYRVNTAQQLHQSSVAVEQGATSNCVDSHIKSGDSATSLCCGLTDEEKKNINAKAERWVDGKSTRHRSLRQDLEDTSWADD